MYKRQALSAAKGFLLSSDYEGMPNGLLEAMAMGLPCISTDCPCGGPREVIHPMENGILVPVGDDEAMANAIIRLLEDASLRSCLGQNAQKTAEAFRPEPVFRHWKEFVETR